MAEEGHGQRSKRPAGSLNGHPFNKGGTPPTTNEPIHPPPELWGTFKDRNEQIFIWAIIAVIIITGCSPFVALSYLLYALAESLLK